MKQLDRRDLFHAGIALAVPVGGISLFSGCQQALDETSSDESSDDESAEKVGTETKEEDKGTNMQVQYLEIVTPEADAVCKQYSEVHGLKFSEPVANFGNARTAKLEGGGMIGIRGPLREDETPVVRPYMLVEDIKAAVAAASEAGAKVAVPPMEIPEQGQFAVLIQGRIEFGFWQL